MNEHLRGLNPAPLVSRANVYPLEIRAHGFVWIPPVHQFWMGRFSKECGTYTWTTYSRHRSTGPNNVFSIAKYWFKAPKTHIGVQRNTQKNWSKITKRYNQILFRYHLSWRGRKNAWNAWNLSISLQSLIARISRYAKSTKKYALQQLKYDKLGDLTVSFHYILYDIFKRCLINGRLSVTFQ